MSNKKGRPKKDESDKKRIVSVTLSQDVIDRINKRIGKSFSSKIELMLYDLEILENR